MCINVLDYTNKDLTFIDKNYNFLFYFFLNKLKNNLRLQHIYSMWVLYFSYPDNANLISLVGYFIVLNINKHL